ncbi:hypothetical protein Y032_0142g2298 [Ancylostoma ceylanicum]|uniref:Tyr recombinase domain-containing protein n=1 Tax=Ancylostoma ceylanicum TaxID=53326 RepID=A0A016T3E2_9BILA|nr:hypothetical protein Y032_0142g2298 [Ancylostoma ceylanicum]
MTEEVSPERVDLIASISSQVADGIGPLISDLVEKKIKDQKDQRKGKIEIPTLNHPGLKAQAELLAKWIQDVDEIDAAPTEESRRERTEGLKKSLKRRLTTVVGADTDSTIFHLADAYEKVESVIDESDDFGKAVAEHLKKSAAKATEAKKKPRVDYPFRRGGYPAGTGVPAPAFTQFPSLFSPPQYPNVQQLQTQFGTPAMHTFQGGTAFQPQQFYGFPPIRGTRSQQGATSRACYNLREWVTVGFKVNFIGTPPQQPTVPRNRRSALVHHEFVDDSLEELLATQAITESPTTPLVVSPLSVAEAGEAQLYTRALSAKCATESTPLDWHFSLDEDENFELEYWQERLNAASSDPDDELAPMEKRQGAIAPNLSLLRPPANIGGNTSGYGRYKRRRKNVENTYKAIQTDQYGTGATIFLAKELWFDEILRRRINTPPAGQLLNTANGAQWSEGAAATEIRRLCEKAGIRRLSPHAFRRGGTTLALEEGVPMELVQRRGRWASSRSMKPYIAHSATTQGGPADLIG